MQVPVRAPALLFFYSFILLFFCYRLLLFLRELSCQPTAPGFVIQFQAEECQSNARHDDKCGNSQTVVKRVNIILNEPSVEDIHNRVVYNVKRV